MAGLSEDLEDLFENAPCGYLLLRPSGEIFRANATLISWLGFAHDAVMGKKIQTLLNISSRIFYETHFIPRLRMEGLYDEVALNLVKSDGKPFPVLVNAVERRDSAGATASTAMTIFNATDRRRFEQELLNARNAADSANAALNNVNIALEKRIRESERLSALLQENEARLRMAQEAGRIGSFEIDIASDQITATEQFCRIFGLPFQFVFPVSIIDGLIFPGDEALVWSKRQRDLGQLDLYSEYRIRKGDTAETVWISRRAQLVRDENGGPLRLLGTVQDITERKAIDERQKMLNEELSHRMKNTMSLVQAIASQTLRDAADRPAVHAFSQRITALSHAHEILLRQNWAAASKREVVRGVLALHGNTDRFSLTGPEVNLGPKAALSLSLLLHELATNAVKYGALSNATGHVDVAWEKSDADLVLQWTEHGGPPVNQPVKSGLGSRLIGMGLAGAGTVTRRYDDKSFSVEFRVPLKLIEENRFF